MKTRRLPVVIALIFLLVFVAPFSITIPVKGEDVHDLRVSLKAGLAHLKSGNSRILNATVYNDGNVTENNVHLEMFINGSIKVDSMIAELLPNGTYTSGYYWKPSVDGVYNVTAYAPPVNGESYIANNIGTKWVNVCTNKPPVANFTVSPEKPIADVTVTFNATPPAIYYPNWENTTSYKSYDPDWGNITSYNWDFGDGVVVDTTTPVFTHTYSYVIPYRKYTVRLIVRDTENLSNSTMKSITIYSRPTASLKVTGPRFPGPYYVNETITFDASESSDRDGYITSYRWIFGDGTPQAIENDSITTHAYTSEGTYTPTLWVTDNDTITSLPSTIIPPIKVESGVPVANFTVSPKPEYYVCKTLTFDASSSNPKGGYIVNYTWNFDDGNITTVSAPIIIHHYNESRTYLVILTVTDNYTITSPPFQILVHVYRRLYIADYIYGNAEIVYNPGQAFKVNVTVAGATDLYSYQFNFTWSKNILNCTNIESAGFLAPENFTRIYPNGSGYAWVNGTRTGGGTGVNGSGTLAIISFTVLNTGKSFLNFSYAALINSTGGGINFALVNGTFYTSKPAAYFEPSKRHGVCNETITFDASKSYDPDGGDIIIYHWYWGDGTYTLASLSSTTHAYKNPENYTVTLKVIDDDGETWNFTDPMEIEIVLYGDVAVNEVESLRNETAGILNITVTVTNKGNITQAFNITIYYDSTPIKTPLSSSVTNPFTVELPANASRTVTFMWDIVNNKVPRGNYTIKAVTSLPEGQIDRNPLDNEKSEDHTVKVRVRGDLNDDHVTDISDLVILVGAMPSIPGSPKWYQYADLNCDNKVDINDLIIVILLIPSFDS